VAMVRVDGLRNGAFSSVVAAVGLGPNVTLLTLDVDAVRRRMRDGTERAIPLVYPASYPRFARVLGDSEGNVWVMRYPDVTEPVRSDAYTSTFTRRVPPEGALWRVVAPDGSVLAQIRTPLGLFVIEIGPDWLLGVREDELDRQSVEVWGLGRQGGRDG